MTIEYVALDEVAVVRPPMQKQIWDGEKFVPMMLQRCKNRLSREQRNWLLQTYGPCGTYVIGRYRNYTDSGSTVWMDEKVYMMFQLKWAGK